jgi:hypothetical protein
MIAPLWEIGLSIEDSLPEDLAIAVVRYAAARWGRNHTAWMLAFEGSNVGKTVARWRRFGHAVVGANTCQFATPSADNWLLVIKEGK